jgi:hypothetical protein
MGLHAWKHVVFMRFENVYWLRNIVYIRPHLSEKDEAITQKR